MTYYEFEDLLGHADLVADFSYVTCDMNISNTLNFSLRMGLDLYIKIMS